MRVPDDVRKCVAFVGSTAADGIRKLRGTAFCVGKKVDDLHNACFAVTAAHVLNGIRSKGEQGWLRLNMKDGRVEMIDFQIDDWFFPTDTSVDAAAIPIANLGPVD